MKSKHWPFVLYIITLFYQVFGQTILYVGFDTDVTLNCPFRQTVTDNLSINEASETKTYESTDDIKLRCLANLQNNDITFTAWTHRDIGIYTCNGYNKYNRRMKSQDIQINVNDQPVFTDNITIRDSDRMTEINKTIPPKDQQNVILKKTKVHMIT
ncbi:hypothetical protein KUTeg_006097 [Tegillarca granosa]|uniref:Uncharacterized protein n=1 Tax=Tegillarca granosa TaxID=220873 RepID=A0ABQ9FFG9_TEGGR|nr:hypothetical protein KUTeg_006097 [Tegillarca granosa]